VSFLNRLLVLKKLLTNSWLHYHALQIPEKPFAACGLDATVRGKKHTTDGGPSLSLKEKTISNVNGLNFEHFPEEKKHSHHKPLKNHTLSQTGCVSSVAL